MATIAELKNAVQAAEAAYEAARAKIRGMKKIDRVMNEGGEGYSSYEAESERLYNHHAPIIKAAEAALFAAEWTPAVFAERRAAWNAGVAQAKSNADITALQNRLGYGINDLRAAKELLGIQ